MAGEGRLIGVNLAGEVVKGTVLQQLGVKSAVGRVVYVLEEQAYHVGVDLGLKLIFVYL